MRVYEGIFFVANYSAQYYFSVNVDVLHIPSCELGSREYFSSDTCLPPVFKIAEITKPRKTARLLAFYGGP